MNVTPPELRIIERHLTEIGYKEPTGSTVSNYEFIVARNQTWTANIMAFGDPRRFDISTSCIAVQWWPNEKDKTNALQSLRHIGAPIALFVSVDRVEIWPILSEPKTAQQPKETWSYASLPEYFSHHRRDFIPDAILQAKKGERQLSFFDIDPSLESFARHATQETLAEQFMETIAGVPDSIRQQYPTELTRVAISILAARILQDKLKDYEDLQVRNIEPLLQALQTRFPNYFTNINSDIKKVGHDTLKLLYSGLSEFTFRSLTNDMLAYFYENVFVDKQLQHELGIHYTPRYITERILKHLPLEDLPPETRVVLDGTSGSGNMLLAAYDRLSKLLPARWSLEECHNYLLGHIFGIDIDPLACEIARLSLLLYDLPMGDSWQVKNADIFEATPHQLFDEKPNVIVSNPPFKEPRSTEGKRVQIASEVLKKYLDWLPANGLLGVVVPLTFLNNASVSNERKRLLTECDILEIWHLSQGAVSHWSAATAIILARKLKEKEFNTGSNLTRVIEVIGTDRRKFEQFDQPTFSYVVSQLHWLEHPKYIMDSSVIDPICQRISHKFPAIHNRFAILFNGVQPGKEARKTNFSYEKKGDINKKILYNNADGKFLEPYRIDWHSQNIRYIKYPEGIQWPRQPEHFELPVKVIFNATRNAGGPWRFYAAIDRDNLIPSENFHYALSTKEVTAEEIAATLNSPVANAWFASQFQGRDINLTVLKQLPFPKFDKEQKERIQHLVSLLTKFKEQIQSIDLEKVRSYILELDEIIFDAYEISQEERQQLLQWIGTSPRPRPGVEWKNMQPRQLKPEKQLYQGRRWILSGEVKDINKESQTLLIQIDSKEIEIPIPLNMPGWVLRPKVVFEASIPWSQASNEDLSTVDWLDFEPLGYDYLTDDELLSTLVSSLTAD